MQKRFLAITSVLVGISFLFSSCATIILGRSQEVGISSNPAGARASVDSVQVITPGQVTLKRNRDYVVKIEKEGYAPAGATINSRPSWWLLGNVIFGGLIGLIIDLAIGGGYTLSPDHVDVTLQKES